MAQPALYDGERLIREGRYQDALNILLPGYMNDPTAELAYAIARAYDGSRDDPRALKFYQAALHQRGLPRKARTHSKRRVRAIKKRLRNRPQKATLSIKANVAGALVRIDGQEIGRTPLAGVLIPPGQHTLTVTHDYWETWEKRVSVAPFDQVHLDANLLDKPTDVLVHTNPAGASAMIGGGQSCMTPCLFSLRGGNYKLTITRDGNRPLIHDFIKPPGQLLELRLRMVPLGGGPVAVQGYIQVNVDQPGSDIAVNGQVVARSPITQPLGVAPGQHRIAVNRVGFQPWVRDVAVAPAQTTTINVVLLPGRSATPGFPVNPQPGVGPGTPIRVNPGIGPVARPAPVTPGPFVGGPSTDSDDTAGWWLVGSGIAAILGGGGMTTLGLLDQRTFNTAVRFKIENDLFVSGLTRQDVIDLEKSANLKMGISYGLYGLGAGLLITGIVLLNNNESMGDPLRAPSLGVAPLLGPDITGAQAQWRF
ncbi:MAG: hypothetical protein ACI9WU_003408 [Myxococcota bacterium]